MSINLNDKSKVKNLCPWNISWERQTSEGDEFLKANQVAYIVNSEIETQVQNGNSFFIGTGNGEHARVFIENSEMREYLGFDNKSEGFKQLILDDDKCKQILEYKTFSTFKKHVEEEVVTNQEKAKIVNYAKKSKMNDYDKVKFLENHCGLKFKEDEE